MAVHELKSDELFQTVKQKLFGKLAVKDEAIDAITSGIVSRLSPIDDDDYRSYARLILDRKPVSLFVLGQDKRFIDFLDQMTIQAMNDNKRPENLRAAVSKDIRLLDKNDMDALIKTDPSAVVPIIVRAVTAGAILDKFGIPVVRLRMPAGAD